MRKYVLGAVFGALAMLGLLAANGVRDQIREQMSATEE